MTQSYQVIARKYRPRRFSDVVGQEHVSQTLANAIEQNRIAHAYLFVGPRGTGKTTLARIFAKCLNCTGGPKVDFSDDDPRVQEISEGRALDVLEIDGASNRGIEEIRELRETVKYAPATSRHKIYIIDEVHMLTKEAFNALLKTLEEPPEHVKFLFATTEPEKVLPTILSRCQRFDLRRIPAALIVKHLSEIARLEQVQIDEPALRAIARGSEGCMRDAESTLDQLISFCGDRIVESDVLSMFGLAARHQILSLSRAVLAGETETALREFNALAQAGKDLGRLLAELIGHWRNLLLYQICQGDLKLLEISEAEAVALRDQAALADSPAITRILEVLTDCEARFREVTSRKILLEVALLKAIQSRHAVSLDSVLAKLRELQKTRQPAGAAAPAAIPSQPEPEPQPIETVDSPAGSAQTMIAPAQKPPDTAEALWSKVIDQVGRVSPFAKSWLASAQTAHLAGNLLTVAVEAEHFGLVDSAKNRSLIRQALADLGLPETEVKFVQGTESAKAEPSPPPTPAVTPVAPKSPARTPTALNKQDFKNDPLIREAIELFKGQIVEAQKS